MPTTVNTANVAYCFDESFSPYAAVSTYSLISNSKKPTRIFWCVPREISGKIENLRNAIRVTNNCSIEIVPLDVGMFDKWHTTHHLTRGTYYRLLLPHALPVDRVVYIDGDTIVLKDMHELFDVQMQAKEIAGVIDPTGGSTSKIPRSQSDPYINTGVLVMDLAKLRAGQFTERCSEILAQYGNQATWCDQCLMNKYAEGRKFLLPPKWNRQIFSNSLAKQQSEQVIARDYSSICHFVGPVKPWTEWCNPLLSDFWWGYARNSRIPNLAVTRITKLEQAITLSESCHRIEQFERASRIKSQIISQLMKGNESKT